MDETFDGPGCVMMLARRQGTSTLEIKSYNGNMIYPLVADSSPSMGFLNWRNDLMYLNKDKYVDQLMLTVVF